MVEYVVMKKSVLIKNGRIIDPKQNIDRVASLLIEDGRIKGIFDESETFGDAEEFDDATVIDATGKIVCPGFVDIHMHEDLYLAEKDCLETHMAESALLMGVTTQIGGNCGENVYPPDRYLDILERDGAPVNVGLLVGHTFLRGEEGRHDKYKPIGQDDLDKMVQSCQHYLDAGCLGVSYGVKYIPGTTWEEIISLAKLCKKDNKLVASHVRMDVEEVFASAEELARICREADVKVQFSHVGSMGGYGQMSRLLPQLEGYHEEGLDLLCDCYPYSAFSTVIGATTYDEGFLELYEEKDYSGILIVNGKYAGRRCTKEIYEDLRANAPDTATVAYFMKDEDIDMALLSPLVMVGSDGLRKEGRGHPRASGTFPRFIKNYIKTGRIGLMEGLAKMTSMPAERLNLSKKGNLYPGSDADIVIFDLEEISDCATFEDGQIPPKGIDYVLIGGEIAADHGRIVKRDLGKCIRR